jgi:Ornithine/acetylornithine aminotransferase
MYVCIGFLIGLQINKDQTNFINQLFKYKLLTIKAADNVVRILPPLNVKKNEINLALKIIKTVCKEYK